MERNKPKTRSSRRTISLDDATMAVLGAHRQRSSDQALLCGTTLPADAYLFSGEVDGSKPWRPDSTTRKFRHLSDSIGIGREIHLHSLRHFVVTTLLGAGVELPQVAGRVGHGGGGHTTLSVYSHFQKARDREVADLLARILQRPEQPGSRGHEVQIPIELGMAQPQHRPSPSITGANKARHPRHLPTS